MVTKAAALVMIGVVFATLTRADHVPLYVAAETITEVTAPFAGACPPNARAFVRTLNSTYCVLESPEEAVRLLQAPPTMREVR